MLRAQIIRADGHEVSYSEQQLAIFRGEKFTGYSFTHDSDAIDVQSFIGGFEFGMYYGLHPETGALVHFTPLQFGGMAMGAEVEWDEHGRIESETISGLHGSNRVLRKWGADGRLHSDRREKDTAHDRTFEDLGLGFVPWVHTARAQVGERVKNYSFGLTAVVPESELRWDPRDERSRLGGEAFWGYLLSWTDQGRTRVRQVLDGRDEGPVWEWAPSGKLVLQGVLHHPHGRVGPWHEWDETGRLTSETIYDALGNRIIDRHFDEVGNLAQEQHHEPTRLWTDPGTGRQRSAPWLWF